MYGNGEVIASATGQPAVCAGVVKLIFDPTERKMLLARMGTQKKDVNVSFHQKTTVYS